jgi:hypothetical protein
MLPEVAVIVVEPAAMEPARPWEPAALLIVAAPVFEELQMTEAVRSCIVSSEKVPVAVNCCVVPLAMPGLVGVRAIDTNVASEMVTVVSPEASPDDALMCAVPTPLPVTCPGLSIVALLASDVLQVTVSVTSLVLLFAWVAVAVNCWLVYFANDAFGGVSEIDTIGEESVPLPSAIVFGLFPPQPAKPATNSDTTKMNHTFFCNIEKPSSVLSK